MLKPTMAYNIFYIVNEEHLNGYESFQLLVLLKRFNEN